ncbi:hypothetical protein TNCV_3041441 [Trichonephila clavipes]|nr:hypothetical protein TNCV_3041441 [Trichonephila clavipes]
MWLRIHRSRVLSSYYALLQKRIVAFYLLLAVDYGMFGAVHRAHGDRLLCFREKVIDPQTRWSGKERRSLVFWNHEKLYLDLVLRKQVNFIENRRTARGLQYEEQSFMGEFLIRRTVFCFG